MYVSLYVCMYVCICVYVVCKCSSTYIIWLHVSLLISSMLHVSGSISLLTSVCRPPYLQEPSERRAVEVKLPYLPHTITMPENVQKREVGMG